MKTKNYSDIRKHIWQCITIGQIIIGFLLSINPQQATAQNDVMLQAFYWDVPVDTENTKGLWWNNLRDKSTELKKWGITGIWVPSPSKGNWGIIDMGYGIYDHYDLGNYFQKGSIETRFGSRKELTEMIAAMHDTSGNNPRIAVYADIILNHIYASNEDAENNPAVKQYVFDEAFRQGQERVPYPTDEIKWTVKKAPAGYYYIKIKGYNLNFDAPFEAHGYELWIDYKDNGYSNDFAWEAEPNNSKRKFNDFPGSGQTMRAFINHKDDVDVFRIYAPGGKDITMRLAARKLSGEQWQHADQTNGYYPFEVWHKSRNITHKSLEAHTNTGLSFPARNCDAEQQWTWNYSHFHPSNDDGWLGDWGVTDEIIANTKGYGNDLNTFLPEVQQRMNDWGRWLAETIKFDGFRLDFVRGFQESYAASWINSLPPLNNNHRFIVGEYWGSEKGISAWVNTLAEMGAISTVFDFPLKAILTEMCNGDENFDMTTLNHAGLIRNNTGHQLPDSSVVTFLENHDTGKEHDKWVTRDWHLGYAYLLTHQGRPCLFYPHLYGISLQDFTNHDLKVEIPSTLIDDIHKLIHIRTTYLEGEIAVLSHIGNPEPLSNTRHIYVARREGGENRSGAIIVINNSETEKGLWVDANNPGWADWSNTTLTNALDETQSTLINSDGRVWVKAPARSFAVYVPSYAYIHFEKPE